MRFVLSATAENIPYRSLQSKFLTHRFDDTDVIVATL